MDGVESVTKRPSRLFMYSLEVFTSIIAAGIAVYWIKHPEFFHPEKRVEYQQIVPISDLNNDGIPELRVQYKDGSIDTLISRIEGNKIIHQP